MAVGQTRDLTQHSQVEFAQGVIQRAPSPAFAPPNPRGMIEPGTNWLTIVTADGPHTTEHPGVNGGRLGMANYRAQDRIAPLTRKGG